MLSNYRFIERVFPYFLGDAGSIQATPPPSSSCQLVPDFFLIENFDIKSGAFFAALVSEFCEDTQQVICSKCDLCDSEFVATPSRLGPILHLLLET